MKKTSSWFFVAASVAFAGCGQYHSSSPPVSLSRVEATSRPANDVHAADALKPDSVSNSYSPPSPEEMAPMPSAYLKALATVREPPEMAKMPMETRRPISRNVLEIATVTRAVGSLEKTTHEQRAKAIHAMLEIANSKDSSDGIDRVIMYGAIAAIACFDGAPLQVIIDYSNTGLGDSNDNLALRARMYLKAGARDKALDALTRILAEGDGHAIAGGDVDPRKQSSPCGWSIADFDALGDDPRSLAAKGLYLSAFIGYGAETRRTVLESDIRELYARSGELWHSPIPHFLEVTVNGFGSEHSMSGFRCIRSKNGGDSIPEIVSACARYDDGLRREIRELTMALVIDPKYGRALAARAGAYRQLAEAAYQDGKPSRHLFELAISDYTVAIAAGGNDKHTLYCDRALSLASTGRYRDAVFGYEEAMRFAKDGIENDPFVYEQLANLYIKTGKFLAAADLLTQAIMRSSGGGMDAVIFLGGMGGFRTLYPEYELLPDTILAEAVRRRYLPQLAENWDEQFISKGGVFNGKIASSILPELYVMRGDAYMKAGRRAEAMADYQRVKSDAWSGTAPYLPRSMYFNPRGDRKYDMPETWPPPPAMF